MFDDVATYERVRDSGVLSREVVGKLYGLPSEKVKFFLCDHAFAIKASIPRPAIQGDLNDSDGHGGQQYARGSPQYDLGSPSTCSATLQRMSC